MSAKFLRHEGFLGAVGAFLKVHPMTPPSQAPTGSREPRKVRRFCLSGLTCAFIGSHISAAEAHTPVVRTALERRPVYWSTLLFDFPVALCMAPRILLRSCESQPLRSTEVQ